MGAPKPPTEKYKNVFKLQETPGNNCPVCRENDRLINTKRQCKKAYNEAIGEAVPFDKEEVGNWANHPPGCHVAMIDMKMIRYFNTRNNKNNGRYINFNNYGRNNGDFLKICNQKVVDIPFMPNGKRDTIVAFSSDSLKKIATTHLNLNPKYIKPWLENPKKHGLRFKDKRNIVNYIELNAQRTVTWKKITTMGIPGLKMFITKYQIWFWTEKGEYKPWNFGKVLNGNRNDKAQVTRLLNPPIVSPKIRIVVKNFHRWPALRIEAYFSERLVEQTDFMYYPLHKFPNL